MAYGFGTGVQAGLGATDYSNYLRGVLSGAQMEAQGTAAIGQGIGNALAALGQGLQGAAQVKREQTEKNRLLKQQEEMQKGQVTSAKSFLRGVLSSESMPEDFKLQAYNAVKDLDNPYLSDKEKFGVASTVNDSIKNMMGLAEFGQQAMQRQAALGKLQQEASDRRVNIAAQDLVSQINQGIPYNELAPGAQETPLSDIEFQRALNSPDVQKAFAGQTEISGKRAVASALESVAGGAKIADAINSVPAENRPTFLKEVNQLYPEANAREVKIGGVDGYVIGGSFHALPKEKLNAEAYSNAMESAAVLIKNSDANSYKALPAEAKRAFNQYAFDASAATGKTFIQDDATALEAFFENASELSKVGVGSDGSATPATKTVPLVPTQAPSTAPAVQPPQAAPTRPVTGVPAQSGYGFPMPGIRYGDQIPSAETPLNLTFVNAFEDVGAAPATTTQTNRANQATQTPAGAGISTAKALTYLAPAAAAAVKYRGPILEAAKVAPGAAATLTGILKDITTRSAKKLAGPVAVAAIANEAVGDVVTLAANQSAKLTGEKQRAYNTTASEYVAEALARTISDPQGKQDVLDRILTEYETVKRSDISNAEKIKKNQFFLELLNKVQSFGASDVPERFRPRRQQSMFDVASGARNLGMY